MEPLVIFGAGLVIYCGYLALLDSSKSWRAWRLRTAANRAPAKKRGVVPVKQQRPRPSAGIAVGRPLLQRV